MTPHEQTSSAVETRFLKNDTGEARTRVDQIHAFRAECAHLAERGLLPLNPAEQEVIHQYHQRLLEDLQQRDVDITPQSRHLSFGLQLVSALSTAAFSASVIFLFAQYWGAFNLLQHILLLICAPVITLILAQWIKSRDIAGYYARLVACVSWVCFGLNLMILGNLLNILPSPHFFAVLALYGFLLAYGFSSRLILAAALTCGITYLATFSLPWSSSGYWTSAWNQPERFLLPSLLVFSVPLLWQQHTPARFSPIYYLISTGSFFLPVLILSHWGRSSVLPGDPALIEGAYQLLGFISAAGLVTLGMRRQDHLLTLLGGIFFALFLCGKFVDWWWHWMPASLFFLVVGLALLLWMLVLTRLRRWQHNRVHQSAEENC